MPRALGNHPLQPLGDRAGGQNFFSLIFRRTVPLVYSRSRHVQHPGYGRRGDEEGVYGEYAARRLRFHSGAGPAPGRTEGRDARPRRRHARPGALPPQGEAVRASVFTHVLYLRLGQQSPAGETRPRQRKCTPFLSFFFSLCLCFFLPSFLSFFLSFFLSSFLSFFFFCFFYAAKMVFQPECLRAQFTGSVLRTGQFL